RARTSRMPPVARNSPAPFSAPTPRRWAPPDPEIQTTATTTPRALRPRAPIEESRTARRRRRAYMPARNWLSRDRSRSRASFVHLCLIHLRIRAPLFFGGLHRSADLDQRAFPDPGTIARCAVPSGLALDDLGPERKRTALRRLRRMNAAAVAL